MTGWRPARRPCSSRRCGTSPKRCATFFTARAVDRRGARPARMNDFGRSESKPGHITRLSRRYGQVWIPKVGWVKFRWTRTIAYTVKSSRVTLDRSGRWHIAFAAVPDPIAGPGDGSVVGVDRGVAVSVALSSGELLHAPGLRTGETKRLRRLQRRLARAQRGSHRRARTKLAIARLRARDTDRRRDIAAGRAVTARGDLGASRSANREPQPCSPAA